MQLKLVFWYQCVGRCVCMTECVCVWGRGCISQNNSVRNNLNAFYHSLPSMSSTKTDKMENLALKLTIKTVCKH